MTNKNSTITYLKDYKKPAFEIKSIDLRFDIFEGKTTVRNQMEILRLEEGATLTLDGDELTLKAVYLNEKPVSESDYKLCDESLEILNFPQSATLVIETEICPENNKALSGLYYSDGLYCTQCEAEGFRRMSFYLDRPDVLSRYTTTITADKKTCPILLSNGNLIKQGDLDGGRHFATWEDPFKKPSYLFALVAGDLGLVEDEFITRSSRTVALKMYVEKGNENKCEHALSSLKASMKWDEEKYGREYDLDIFMIVAVSTFNMGAMENKGLNIFNDKYVLARPELATDQDYAGIEGVIAHEYFHNWTGNRVTCRDWFQLSLKEGLTVFRDQSFSEDMNSKTVCRIQDVDVLRTHQFPEDKGPTAHPVRPESYLEINNFYTTTIYNKGAEVIRMQQTLVSEEGFRKGTDLYFERFDGQAVTIDDFVSAMSDANQVDLSQFKRWYSQAGTPVVRVTETFNEGVLSLNFKQHCPKTPGQEIKKPFHIPITFALFNQEGKRIEQVHPLIELKKEEESFEFSGFTKAPRVSLLRGFSAPIKLERELSLDYLMDLARFESDGFAKCEAVKLIARSQILNLKADPYYSLSEKVVNLYRSLLLEDHQDNALKALLLTTPGFEYLVQEEQDIEVDSFLAAIQCFETQLAEHLEAEFIQTYGQLMSEARAEINGQQAGFRALKNRCLYFLTRTSKGLELARKQQGCALTMTDELAAFKLICERENEYFNEAKEAFFKKWSHEHLVLDKWFSVLASSDCENILERINSLSQHEKFSESNPNKVRALIGAFIKLNVKHFHAKDGSGYQLAADWVKRIDPNNPQLASALVQELTLWRRYDEGRQALMKQKLVELKEIKGLSRDVYEKVSKALL